jgi:hypothetical protein
MAKKPFTQFLSSHEAEGLPLADANSVSEVELEVKNTVPLLQTVVFMFARLLESLAWLVYDSFLLITRHYISHYFHTFLTPSIRRAHRRAVDHS